MDVQALTSCSQLTTEHATAAARSAAALRELCTRCAEIAKPEEGCPKILMALARTSEADWIEGDLLVEITGDEERTSLAVFADHGFGIRERIVPNMTFRVPFEEFERALMIAPALIQPLRAKEQDGKLLLGRSVRESSPEGFAAITIDDRSLHETERKTAPPKVQPPEVMGDVPPRDPPEKSGVHTHPTVRRMVAIRPEALRSGNNDD